MGRPGHTSTRSHLHAVYVPKTVMPVQSDDMFGRNRRSRVGIYLIIHIEVDNTTPVALAPSNLLSVFSRKFSSIASTYLVYNFPRFKIASKSRNGDNQNAGVLQVL